MELSRVNIHYVILPLHFPLFLIVLIMLYQICLCLLDEVPTRLLMLNEVAVGHLVEANGVPLPSCSALSPITCLLKLLLVRLGEVVSIQLA